MRLLRACQVLVSGCARIECGDAFLGRSERFALDQTRAMSGRSEVKAASRVIWKFRTGTPRQKQNDNKTRDEKKPVLRPVFSENNPKITWPERLQPALRQRPERQRQQASHQQPEQRRQPAWQRQQQERRQPALHQQPEQQRPELQQQEQQQVPVLLPSCRKQPGQQPTTKRSTESFS